MALELIKGTNVPIVDVLIMARDMYTNYQKRPGGESSFGMCVCIHQSVMLKCKIFDGSAASECLYKRVHKFDRKIAVENFDAKWYGHLWWDVRDASSRLKYFEWLISEYSVDLK